MAERSADIALRGGVRKVALPARHRQLLRQMAQQRVGDADVAFRVLEIDRIHLVRHRRGSDLAALQLLREVAERDIPPDIAVEVEQDAVGTRIGIEQLRDPVVRLDLRGVRVEFEAEALDEAPAQALPIEIRIGQQVRVVVSHGAVDLAEHADRGNALARTREALHEVRHLLAERGRGRRLPVGA